MGSTSGRRTSDDFKRNLTRLVGDVRAKGAFPVLFTPVQRRKFNDDGRLEDTHADDPAYARRAGRSVELRRRFVGEVVSIAQGGSSSELCAGRQGQHALQPIRCGADGRYRRFWTSTQTDSTDLNGEAQRRRARAVFRSIRSSPKASVEVSPLEDRRVRASSPPALRRRHIGSPARRRGPVA